MKEMIVILLSAILTQNFVLSKSLGICPFLGVSKKLDSAVGMSLAVTFVMVLATAATWPIQTYLLDQYDLGYMQTIVFILVIAALVQLVEMILKKFIPPLYESLGIYLPLITTNCAVLGVAVLNIDEKYGFGTDSPDRFTFHYRRDVVNLYTHVACRMRSVESCYGNVLCLHKGSSLLFYTNTQIRLCHL